MFKAIEIANFFIQLANDLPYDSIDNLKLNKLLYFAQGQSLSKLGRPLFSDNIEAWDYGPVVHDVYHTYKAFGKNPIDKESSFFDERNLTSDELDILVDVYMNYGKYSGGTLVQLTHKPNTPWSNHYEECMNNIIPHDEIKSYFDSDPSFQSFEVDYENAPIVAVAPAEWDSCEDSIYG